MHYHHSKTFKTCLSLCLFSVIAGTIVTGCASTSTDSTISATDQHSTEDPTSVTEPVKSCFRNEYSNGDITDVEELKISVVGDQATGEYNWLPAQKDKRRGEFEGNFAKDTVQATYTYEQEGTQESVPISIFIEEDQATVEGGDRQLGLDSTLAKSEC